MPHNVGPVIGIAHGCRGDDMAIVDALGIEKALKAFERAKGDVAAFRMQFSGIVNTAAQPGHDLLVEDRPERPPLNPEMHEAHRIGADIDHRDIAVDRGLGDQRFDGRQLSQGGQLPDRPGSVGGWSFFRA